MAISIGVAFVLTWMFGYKDSVSETCQEAEKEKTQGEKAEAEKLEIQESVTGEILLDSHMEGEAIPMSEVKDETFAAEVLGKGIAIIPKKRRSNSAVRRCCGNCFCYQTRYRTESRSWSGNF